MNWLRHLAWLALTFLLAVTVCGDDAAPDVGGDEQTPEVLAAGEAVYQANCASCHGADLRGSDEGPSLLSIVYEPNHHSDAAFVLAVRNGSQQHHWRFGDMEPVEGLTDEDIASLTAFVRDIQRVEGFEPYPP